MDNNFFSIFYLFQKHEQLKCTNAKNAFIQYKDFRINLLSGERVSKPVSTFFEILEMYKIEDEIEKPIIIHLFYEFGFCCNQLDDLVDNNKALAIFIEYESASIEKVYNYTIPDSIKFTPLSIPSKKEYSKNFKETYTNLLNGECYQLNLTVPFFFRSKDRVTPENYFKTLLNDPLKAGAYAHATYIDSMEKLYLSNSPECLFQICHNKTKNTYTIKTMPIKGTKSVHHEQDRGKAWSCLKNSKKDDAELSMISDLMRNDLTKINLNPSKVIFKKYPLNVPGLIHQFSVIEAELNENTSIGKIIKNIFPGGSITGAPKKNVMKLIKSIEDYDRGFYCGSTLLMYKRIKTASINIRSAEVDYIEDEVKYGSGGAITLLSEVEGEYSEVLDKLKSFLLLLN